MKNLITGSASLVLILALLLQFIYMEAAFQKMRRIEEAEDVLRESIREEGTLTEKAEKEFVRVAEKVVGQHGVVTFQAADKGAPRVPRGELVRFRVRVKVGKKVLAAPLWRIPDRENVLVWTGGGAVVSEYIPAGTNPAA